jgi:uncharacterized phage protein (TIGR02218 family)
MRTASTDMIESLHKEGATLCRCWKFVRSDGTTMRITDHDANVTVAGDGTYRANVGFTASSVVISSTSFSSQQTEITMSLTEGGMREEDIQAHLWSGAVATQYVVDWANPTSAMPMFAGKFGRITINDKGVAVIEVLGKGNERHNVATEIYSMTCRNSLGDHKCLINIENFRCTFTVTAIIDATTYTLSTVNGQPDGYFSFGQLVWDTGENAGAVSEVQSSLKDDKQVGVFFPPPATVAVGDTGHMYPGCDLLVQTCRDKFSNVLNFNGEPFNVQPRIISAPASTGSAAPATGTGNGLFRT